MLFLFFFDTYALDKAALPSRPGQSLKKVQRMAHSSAADKAWTSPGPQLSWPAISF